MNSTARQQIPEAEERAHLTRVQSRLTHAVQAIVLTLTHTAEPSPFLSH